MLISSKIGAVKICQGNIVDSKTVSGDFSFKVKATSNDSSDSEVLDIMNKLDFSGNYAVDYENKVIDLDLNSNYDDKKLLDVYNNFLSYTYEKTFFHLYEKYNRLLTIRIGG